MDREEVDLAIRKFEKALQAFKQGVSEAKTDLEKDGVVQRFEFTFEAFWKSLKIYFANKGVSCRFPKDCLEEAFRSGIIGDEGVFLNMLKDRNITSHVYSEEESERVFLSIFQKNYASAFEGALKQMRSSL